MEKSQSPFLLESESPIIFGQALAATRRRQPVYFDELRDCWVALGHKDIGSALRRPEVFTKLGHGPAALGEALSALDGLCGVQRQAVRPGCLRGYETRILAPAAHHLLDRLTDRGAPGQSVDLIRDFCQVLPAEIARPLLGLPASSIESCQHWANAMASWVQWFDDPRIVASGQEAHRQLAGHLDALATPQVQQAEGLALAVLYTAERMLSCILSALLLHPEALERVQGQPALVPSAIAEALRWASPRSGLLVRVSRDESLGKVRLPAGALLFLCTAAAHHDETVHSSPELYDLSRWQHPLQTRSSPSLPDSLAHSIVHIALSTLLQRLPGLHLLPSARLKLARQPRARGVREPLALPVLYQPPAAARAA